MKNVISIVALLISFCSGYFVSQLSSQNTVRDKKQNLGIELEQELNQGRNYFAHSENLTPEEIQTWYNKLLTLFFAQVALRLDNPAILAQLENIKSKDCSTKIENKDPRQEIEAISNPVDQSSTGPVVLADKQIGVSTGSQDDPKEKTKAAHKPSGPFSRVMSSRKYLQVSTPIKKRNPFLEKLDGTFHGKIERKTGKDWSIKLILDYKYNGKYYIGSSSVELSEEGKGVFQSFEAKGENKNLQLNPSDPKAVVLEVSKESFFRLIPVYENKEVVGLMGTYYQGKKDAQVLKYIGKVNINKDGAGPDDN